MGPVWLPGRAAHQSELPARGVRFKVPAPRGP